MDAQPRPSIDMAALVAGNVVAKVAVGLGAPDRVTVGALDTGLGWDPEDTVLTTANWGEMA